MGATDSVKATFLEAISGDHTDAGAAYAALGSALSAASSAFILSSSFNQTVWLSTDGTTDNILVIPDTCVTISIAANKQSQNQLAIPKGIQFYLKQGPDGAPSSGDIAITPLSGS